MATSQASGGHSRPYHHVEDRQLRTQLGHLLNVDQHTEQVVVIDKNGSGVAALVPMSMLGGEAAESRAGGARPALTAVSAHWQARLVAFRDEQRRRHETQVAAVTAALAAAFAALARTEGPAARRELAALRAQHGHLLTEPTAPLLPDAEGPASGVAGPRDEVEM